MFSGGYVDDNDPMAMYHQAMLRRTGQARRFDEYFRCYPIAMLPGPDRDDVNHGGKVFLPPSALDKLTRMHITYPMLFELINGKRSKKTHAGVLEFIAEEGKIYLPYWLMQTLELEPGDLLQVQSTDLPLGSFIKLQPQSTSFLEISDPKAVLENAFRNFSCLTTGDMFTFSYNDNVYSIAVIETRPDNPKKGICTLETDLSVDFAPPVGYEEPKKTSGTSTPRSMASQGGAGAGGVLHSHGTMAQAINYAAIAPSASSSSSSSIATAAASTLASVNFMGSGNRLASKRGTGKASASISAASTPAESSSQGPEAPLRKTKGPQPLRLGPNRLFLGYEITPVKKKGEGEESEKEKGSVHFQGQGQTLRRKKGGDNK